MKTAKEIWLEEFDRSRNGGDPVWKAEENADGVVLAFERRGFLEGDKTLRVEPKIKPHRHVRMRVEYDGKFKVDCGSAIRLASNSERFEGQSNSESEWTTGFVEIDAILFISRCYKQPSNEEPWIVRVENETTPGYVDAVARIV